MDQSYLPLIFVILLLIIIFVFLIVFLQDDERKIVKRKVRSLDNVYVYRHPSLKNSKVYHSHYHRGNHPHRFEHEKFNRKPHKHLHSHGPPVVGLYE